MMGIISLEGLEFHSFHGVYDEEKKQGNNFTVDVYIKSDLEKAAVSDDLLHTIDYTEVYQIVKKEMEIPSKLLEHVVGRIQNKIAEKFPQINSITISLSKNNPPIGGACQRTRVTISKDFPAS